MKTQQELEAMTDFELNITAAKLKNWLVKEEVEDSLIGFNKGYHERYPSTIWAAKQENGEQCEGWEQINFCADWGDCGTLIDECKISVEFDCETECDTPAGWWGASLLDKIIVMHQSNPKRAVAIAYILIKQGEQ